ncbi:ATP-binding cassette domain-containing protein [Nakamurella sp. YIM 132087]|uniref:ATP-binding cassette domain-containing protein n=1 Tax=Nakamurella alba TaxID=2665158 RepID=A0A7K1FJ57_9ACTN|nr:ABC transporter ATP-binding protein [Nakamurella alba]MTD14128.1 ATP-binding cassette domain-containing protein [Nakamurella alba]
MSSDIVSAIPGPDAVTAPADREVAEPAVVVTGVGKRFRLFADRRTNLKEMFTQRRRKTRYEEFWAVQDVSLSIPKGSTFGLVGHNGSGKSTLLKLIAGIHRPTTGTITSVGRISALLELGAGFHPELSGRDNIYLNGAILGLSRKRIDSAIDEIIEFSGLGHFIDVPVKVYSSGMYVRLGFAIAVTLDPEILVIDEIIAVGDEEFQRRCFDYLHRLRKRGVTIIFVTHSMGLVQQLCDGAAWLENGRVKIVGTADEVVNAYLDTVNAAEAERLEEERAEQGGADGESGTASSSGVHDRGSGEVTIDRLEFIDRLGQTRTTAITGDPLTVRVHYKAHTPTDEVVFGLSLRHESGPEIAGPNTRTSGHGPTAVHADGHVDYVLEPLTVNPGKYYLSAAAVDASMLHVYDYWYDAGELTVQPGHGQTQGGLVVLPGSWNLPAADPA